MKKITKITAVILLAAVLALGLVSCKKDDTPSGMIRASDDKADFTLYVPESWTVYTVAADVGAYASDNDPSSVAMMAWNLEFYDTSLEDWWETNASDLGLVFSDVEILSEEDTAIDGLYAKKYTYTASLSGNSYKLIQAACIKKGTVYVFTYTSVPDNFDGHLDEVESMLSNLKIGR